MAITFPLSIPTTNGSNDIAELEWTNINAVSLSISPFSGAQQTQEWSRNQLIARVTLVPLKREDAVTWWGFLRALRSGSGTFLMGDPHTATPEGSAGTAPGSPLVAGASQSGTALNIDGCPTNVTGYLLTGDTIQIGSGSSSRLYTVVEDADTNGSGETTLEIRPALRSSPGDNDTVVVSSCVGVFRLLSNPSRPVNRDHVYEIKFDAMEAI